MSKLLLLLVFVPALLKAQAIKFEEVSPISSTPQNISDFVGLSNGSTAFADVDGDNDQDVVITGIDSFGTPISALYINDGLGSYNLVIGTPFTGMYRGSIAFADIDGDNDQDLLITGAKNSTTPFSELYTNDGLGNFTLVTGAPFLAVFYSSAAFADIDGDNDQDILISGIAGSSLAKSLLYKNDGLGNYTLVTGTTLTGVYRSSVAFADVDGDNDQDILLTGRNAFGTKFAILYTNNGLGIFTLVAGTPFIGVEYGSVAFADVDGDNDQDLLITGSSFANGTISQLFINDGLGNFTLLTGTNFSGVNFSSVAFSDIDGDSDLDLLITGINFSSVLISELYTNDGLGNYSLVSVTPFTNVYYSSVAFTDVDGDNDQDVLVKGFDGTYSNSKLYKNDGLGNFNLVIEPSYSGVYKSSVAFSDIDGDNDQDLIITGKNSLNIPISELYTNDGSGDYTLVAGTPFSGVHESSIAFSDIDGDNDQDLIITGTNSLNVPISELYKNDGSGNYTLIVGTPFPGVYESSIAFSDIDGDNDQDLIITGKNSSNIPISALYKNDGSGDYTLIAGTPFPGVYYSSIAFSDIDGDNDQDILITGKNSLNIPISALYINDGLGNYTLVTGTFLSPVSSGSVAFSDIDGDSDQDLLITGLSSSNIPISKLYKNNGLGYFIPVLGTPFVAVQESSIAFSDLDWDNDQDLLITGLSSSNIPISQLYRNNGSGNFSLVSGLPFMGVNSSSIAFSDIDGDNHQDVLITGSNSVLPISKLYRNTTCYTSAIDIQISCGPYTWIDGNTYTISNNTETYTLPNTTGCDSVVTLHLTINSIVGDTTATACKQFTWYGNTYNSTNDYTQLLTNIDGCDSTVTLHLTINTINTGVTQNGVSLTSVVNGALYKWLDCNNGYSLIPGETNQTFVSTANGSYALEINVNGCIDTSVCFIIAVVGIKSYTQSSYKLYPNPVKNELTIESQDELNQIEVFSITGQLLQSITSQSKLVKIDLAIYEQGVYLVKVHTKDGIVSTTRVVKE